jgi:hypothetical protein
MQIKNSAAGLGDKEDSKYKRSRMGHTRKIEDEENVLEKTLKNEKRDISFKYQRQTQWKHDGGIYILTALRYCMAEPVFLSRCLSGKKCPKCIISDNNSKALTICVN